MTSNCAIDFYPSSFSSRGPQLMGLNAANEGFLNGFVRHARVDTLVAHTRSREEFVAFGEVVRGARGEGFPLARIAPGDNAELSKVGALLHPFPGFGPLAWSRRFGDSRAYSLLGITHTTATHAVMDSIGNLLLAPIEPWDAVVCTSMAVRRTYEGVLNHWEAYLVSRLGATRLPRPELPIIPLGVDTARFTAGAAAEATRARVRGQLGIAEADIVVLWVGRFNHAAKAHPIPACLALEGLARQVPARIVHLQAGWFADADMEGAFKDAARVFAPGVHQVFVDGRQPDVRRDVWAAADIFMSLSDNLQETFGLTPIEAMAAGLPVVVSDWDGYRDTVRDGIDGFRIPTTMPAAGAGEDLALGYTSGALHYGAYCGVTSQLISVDLHRCVEALVALAQDVALRRRMGEAGRQRARELFDWSRVIAKYQDLCSDLAQIRAQAETSAPRQSGRPAFALRGDPFEVFAAYPTQMLAPGLSLVVADGMVAKRITVLHEHGLNRFSAPWRGSVEDMLAIVRAINARPCVTVGELSQRLDEKQRFALVRTLAWMLKMGVLINLDGVGEFAPAELGR
jgi:glycosyltransferase involved in cell wall biosynthesis